MRVTCQNFYTLFQMCDCGPLHAYLPFTLVTVTSNCLSKTAIYTIIARKYLSVETVNTDDILLYFLLNSQRTSHRFIYTALIFFIFIN